MHHMVQPPNTRPSASVERGACTVTASVAPERKRARSAALPFRRLQDQPSPTSPASHSRALSNPATACPARRASPSSSLIRRTSSASSTAGRSGGTVTGPRAALAKARPRPPWARAVSNTSPDALNQIPRPGRVATRSGTIVRSGPTTNRIHPLLRQPLARDDRQRRSGPVSGASSSASNAGAGSVVLSLLRRRVLGLEPVGARRHDHVVGGRLVHVVRANDLDQLVRREIRQIVTGSSPLSRRAPPASPVSGPPSRRSRPSRRVQRVSRVSSVSRRVMNASARRMSSAGNALVEAFRSMPVHLPA